MSYILVNYWADRAYISYLISSGDDGLVYTAIISESDITIVAAAIGA